VIAVQPDQPAVLQEWLVQAAKGITIIPQPSTVGFTQDEWWVEVNNGLGGHAGVGTIIARCTSELEAQLIAVALWALVERSTREQKDG